MKVMIPTPITDAILSSSTIAEPAVGETAWVSAGTYAVGDRRIRTTTHRVYECVQAHAGRAEPPEADAAYWLEFGPTIRWAMFDTQVSTQSAIAAPLTVVLRPGNFNALALYGLDGGAVSVTVKDAPGGTVVFAKTVELIEPPLDWYDWVFGRIRPLSKTIIDGIAPHPDAEVTVDITAASGVTVKAGLLMLGDFTPLVGDEAAFGGVTYGATAELVDFSYIRTDDYGNTSITKRRNASDMRCKLVLPKAGVDFAISVMQQALATPCAWVASDTPGNAGLNCFGLGSGSVSYEGPYHAEISIYVKGLV